MLFPGSVSKGGAGALSPELLASLQALGDNADSAVLPHSLHQVGEAGLFQVDRGREANTRAKSWAREGSCDCLCAASCHMSNSFEALWPL